jgi:hypothetical protein
MNHWVVKWPFFIGPFKLASGRSLISRSKERRGVESRATFLEGRS